MMQAPIPTTLFLGLPLARITTAEFIGLVIGRARARVAPFTVGYLNAAQVNLAFEDPAHARALAAMDCLYADGQAVVWASRRLGPGVPERINAGDFTREFVSRAAEANLKIAVVGGRPEEVPKAAELFRAWHPDLDIVYLHHGYINDADAARIAVELAQADPDLVIVAMGAPRQERRALEWSRAGRPRAWWCVGALLEYYTGTRARAPIWMRRAGLEWLFRLTLEPGRLWRRYIIGNPLFVWRVMRRKPATNSGALSSPNNCD